MERCSCYYQHGSKPVCYGTKEMEECSCGGDESKCNFYPEKRKPKMANEKRLIDANLLIGTCEEIAKHEWNKRASPVSWSDAYEGFIDTIEEMPTVDAVEVVHGRWEPREDAKGFVRCSVCHDCNIYDDWADEKKWNYCPNCGADMR